MEQKKRLTNLYKILKNKYGPHDNWWPADDGRLREWEICVGAILTQNTNWRNVEKALANLKATRLISPEKIGAMPLPKLQKLIMPSGFYRRKAARLKGFAKFVISFPSIASFCKNVTREQLLAVKGIGPETADSILLYACDRPFFVIDAYTRRILSKMKIVDGDESYDELQRLFHASLPRNTKLYKEFHALIVEHAKCSCKKNPECKACSLSRPRRI